MAVQTPTLFNAALGGMMAGMQNGRKGTTALNTPAAYTALATAAAVFATAVDLALTAQAVITAALATHLAALSAPVTTLDPVAGVTANSGESGPMTMSAICAAYWAGSELQGNVADTTTATYTQAVNDVVNCYTAYVTASNKV